MALIVHHHISHENRPQRYMPATKRRVYSHIVADGGDIAVKILGGGAKDASMEVDQDAIVEDALMAANHGLLRDRTRKTG